MKFTPVMQKKYAAYDVRVFKMWEFFEYFSFFFHLRKFFVRWLFMTDDLTERVLLAETENKMKNSFPSQDTDPDD